MIDDYEEYFGFTDVLHENSLYVWYWNTDNYQNTYKKICNKDL